MWNVENNNLNNFNNGQIVFYLLLCGVLIFGGIFFYNG